MRSSAPVRIAGVGLTAECTRVAWRFKHADGADSATFTAMRRQARLTVQE